jgi:hypothetical protein
MVAKFKSKIDLQKRFSFFLSRFVRVVIKNVESVEKVAKKLVRKNLLAKKGQQNGVFYFYYCVQKFSA